jgi:hypothetical protein
VTAPSTVRCVTCSGAIVDTEAGWTHVDACGRLAGWLCPMPHITLAGPAPAEPPARVPAAPEPAHEPPWVAAAAVPMAQHSRPPELPATPLS